MFFSSKQEKRNGWDVKTFDILSKKSAEKGSILIPIIGMEARDYVVYGSPGVEKNFYGKVGGYFNDSPTWNVRVKLRFEQTMSQEHRDDLGLVYGGYSHQPTDGIHPPLLNIALNLPQETELRLETLCVRAKALGLTCVPIWLGWSKGVKFIDRGPNGFDFEIALDRIDFQQNVILSSSVARQAEPLSDYLFDTPLWKQGV